MLQLMGIDDVFAGGEKEMEVKKGGGVREYKGGRPRVDKLSTRPRESIWTPCSLERSQGDPTLHPHYKRTFAVTEVCELQHGFTAPSQPVIYSHCLQPSWQRHTVCSIRLSP